MDWLESTLQQERQESQSGLQEALAKLAVCTLAGYSLNDALLLQKGMCRTCSAPVLTMQLDHATRQNGSEQAFVHMAATRGLHELRGGLNVNVHLEALRFDGAFPPSRLNFEPDGIIVVRGPAPIPIYWYWYRY